MSFIKNHIGIFLKGLVVGLGGIAPGLSGSVLLVIFSLYQKTITAISSTVKSFFRLFKKSERKEGFNQLKADLLFLIPLGIGIVIGVILFSKLVDWLLGNHEYYTRFAFFGLILGTVPLFYKEMTKEGYSKKYYPIILVSACIGFAIFWLNGNLFPSVETPNFVQSVIMGVAYAGSAIIPGVDSAAIMSALGLYEAWVNATATLDFSVLLPAALGLGVGVLGFSFLINKLLSKFYAITYSVIFGFFLTIIPTVLREGCAFAMNTETVVAILFMLLGLAASLFFGNLEKLKSNYEK